MAIQIAISQKKSAHFNYNKESLSFMQIAQTILHQIHALHNTVLTFMDLNVSKSKLEFLFLKKLLLFIN